MEWESPCIQSFFSPRFILTRLKNRHPSICSLCREKKPLAPLAIAFMENSYHSPAVLDFISLCVQRAGLWGQIHL